MKRSSVYTKTGDKGKTSLVGGTRVEKTHVRLEAYGTVDELNSFIGLLGCMPLDAETSACLRFLQNKLFVVGSYLATETESKAPKPASVIRDEDIARIEREIDRLDAELPPLNRFVLPGGGNEAAARAHLCRTVSRRAERNAYRLAGEYPVSDSVLIFLNRLSDYFFVLSRFENKKNGKELYWEQNEV